LKNKKELQELKQNQIFSLGKEI